MLYLNEHDIKEAVSLDEIMDAIEKAFHIYEKDAFFMPDRIHIDKDQNTLLYMPCFSESIFGTKILTLFPDNPKKNEPVTNGLMLLNDRETGKPVCMINGASITAYRTGAVGGVGIRYTSPQNVKNLGVIGTGVQGFYQTLYACKARNFEKVTVFDAYSQKLPEFVLRLQKELPNVEIIAGDSSEEVVKNSDVIITATPSTEPVIPNDKELLKGKHFIAIGSYKPTMHEYPQAIFEIIENLYIDTEFATEESGDIITPLEEGWIKEAQIKPFIDLVNGKKLEEETTLFKSVGMGLFDVVVSELIYTKAKEKGLGQVINL
ncbi:ornithine cyclodeaminase family protein [Tepidibacter hydrothermalis]|uniref:Ornithine cyclodeaminase family protein n=1 Tax=Tepidibacter hydrothermalis TaxID=3036126 RepID=A0ABY8ED52_9FIRM|nr:ornithine cyclodeaminase family protein [Tepidibacter hydrothermalis]WFD09514.1 ornithine cyclodeaminase family protein [Tepidibacter hydrothermalis]